MFLDDMLDSVGGFWNAISGTNSAMKKQQDYNTEMSNTAYQRAVKDMEAAGINPNTLLGGSGGQNPNVPSSGLAVNYHNPISALIGISNVINSAGRITSTMNSKNEIANKMKIYNKTNDLMNSAVKITSDEIFKNEKSRNAMRIAIEATKKMLGR